MTEYNRRLRGQYDLLADRRGDTIHETDADAFRRHIEAYDPDGQHRRASPPDGDKPWSTATCATRLQHLQQVALAATDATDTDTDDPQPLSAYTTDDVNALLDAWYDELTAASLRQRQLAVRKFLWHAAHDDAMPDYAADPDGITVDDQPETTVDKVDILDFDDIEALRKACRNTRDRALLEMLVYTGQRITALLTLRLKDVYPDKNNGEFRLNPDADGLKGADGHRPLLGSVAAVRNWLTTGHPEPDNPDAHLFTPLPQYTENPDVTRPMHHAVVNQALQRLKERAGVTKPCNAHNFRHTFVTLAYREYGLEKDYIKKLIGHDDGSTVMETTYRHLDDDDTIAAAERAFGLRDDEEASTLTPPACLSCGAGLSPDAKACENCGVVYAPSAVAVQQHLDDDVKESYAQTMPEGDLQAKLATFESLLDDPEVEAYLRDRVDESV